MEPLDSHLTNSQRQGIWSQSLNLDVNTLQRISYLTVFGTQPLNPEFDTISNNNYYYYSIQAGMLTPWFQKSELKDTAFIHSPTGKCIGSLPIKRLATLILLYKQSNKTYTKAALAEATANLIMRYTDGYKHDTKHTTKWQNQACSPLNNTKCMTDYFEIRCERFASPLNADLSRHNTSACIPRTQHMEQITMLTHAHGLESPCPTRNLFVVGGLGFEFCVFVASWRHALRSEWLLLLLTRNLTTT